MARVKTGTVRRKRHNKILQSVKGHRLSRGRHYKVAQEEALHADQYSHIGRKLKKRDFRKLWIQRINAGLSNIENSPSYNVFIHLLKQNHINLNRKMLAELAVNDFAAFKQVVTSVYGQ